MKVKGHPSAAVLQTFLQGSCSTHTSSVVADREVDHGGLFWSILSVDLHRSADGKWARGCSHGTKHLQILSKINDCPIRG